VLQKPYILAFFITFGGKKFRIDDEGLGSGIKELKRC
jgi:hypothetical protein